MKQIKIKSFDLATTEFNIFMLVGKRKTGTGCGVLRFSGSHTAYPTISIYGWNIWFERLALLD